jgi:predicted SAM-dependent methyltransferase
MSKKYLNLGCGSKFHKDWTNADISPRDKTVLKCNFLKGLPFEDESFDLVYHSHIIEHMTKQDGIKFISECIRVLKPGGIIRIATPDLERLASEYLRNLQRVRNNERNANYDYDWILLELYDQTVRNYPGGMMQEYLEKYGNNNSEYINNRIGLDVNKRNSENNTKSRKDTLKKYFKSLIGKSNNVFLKPIVYFLVGKYRFMGEVHLWLYDSYSLQVILTNAGCKDVITRTAQTSYVLDWKDFQLDNPNETSSIFIEAIK